MGEGGGFIQRAVKKTLIGFELQRVRLHTAGVGDHAVGGHNSETFDAIGAGHADHGLFCAQSIRGREA
jgi:hypothetical protein